MFRMRDMLVSEKRRLLIIPFAILLVFSFVFRSLLSNLATHLLDWNDFPYYVWTLDQQINHLRSGNLFSVGNGSIFYPHQGVMYFSDLLLPQAVFGVFLRFFTSNAILIFNYIFLITFALNTFVALWMWKKITVNWWVLFFAVLSTAASPFVFLQLGHVQMISFWPFLICLGLLLDQKSLSFRVSLLIGFWMGIQFLSSVYLTVFLVWTILLWYISILWERWQKKQNIMTPVTHFLISFGLFVLIISPFLFQYFKIQKEYQISRSYGEYVFYAAHATDYLFQPYRSLLSQNMFAGWNKFNQHVVGELAGWPGFSIVLLAILGLFSYSKNKFSSILSIKIDQSTFFWGSLVISGWLFSLGPRLNINGMFANIPLPYGLIMKVFPLVEPVRATSRWSFLLYLGLVFFAIKGLEKITHFHWQKSVALLAIVIYCAEILPMVKPTEARAEYQHPAYEKISSICNPTKVLLEYPLNRMVQGQDISQYLSYKTQIMLASTSHHCYLVNGYSGFTPVEIEEYESLLNTAVAQNDAPAVLSLLKQKNVSLIKLNLDALNESESAQAVSTFSSIADYQLMFSDSITPIYSKL